MPGYDPLIQSLKEQGYEIGETARFDEGERTWILSRGDAAWVKHGQEMIDLAAGRITMKEIAKQRRVGL